MRFDLMMMKALLPVFCLLLFAQSKALDFPQEISPEVRIVLEKVGNLMDLNQYEAALQLIYKTQLQPNSRFSSYDLYFLHSFEAEIMYYNALFKQGLNIALWSLELAEDAQDSLLIGNSENFIGLFLLNLENYLEAKPHFLRSVKFLQTPRQSSALSSTYHALGNLGECYLKLGMPDSAIYYSEKSGAIAQNISNVRAVALANANIAEAYIQKQDWRRAIQIAEKGFESMQNTDSRDVVQIFCMVLMKANSLAGKLDMQESWMQLGLNENDNPLNNDLSRISFLKEALKTCEQIGDSLCAKEMQYDLNILLLELNSKQQAQQITLLKDHFDKNQALILAKETAQIQSNELKLRSTIIIILGILAIALFILIVILRSNSRQRYRIAQLQHKEQLQRVELNSLRERMEAVFSERNRIASDLHDDIGAALSSITIYSGAAEKQFVQRPEETLSLIRRISNSSSSMMDKMSDIVWSIQPTNDLGENLVLRMKTFASEVLSSLDVAVKYEVDQEVESIQISAMTRKNIYLIFKEAINNIAKYSKASAVTVVMHLQENQLILKVMDNGIGFSPKLIARGNGLDNMKNRAEAIDGEFSVVTADGAGCQINLSVKIAEISDIVSI